MTMTGTKSSTKQTDPLYAIFEQHLLNFQDADTDRKTFIGQVIKDYLSYLRKMNIIIPRSLEEPVIEELAPQVNTMLVKKIYGCLTIQEYAAKAPTKSRRPAGGRVGKLAQATRKLASTLKPDRRGRAVKSTKLDKAG